MGHYNTHSYIPSFFLPWVTLGGFSIYGISWTAKNYPRRSSFQTTY
nr:MAG TPA: hypothetical protein [Bacteriophage sp.]